MKKYMRNHMRLFIVLIIFTVLVIGCFVAYNAIFVNNQTKYGTRLDGIDSVKITNDKKQDITDNIKSLEIAKSIEIKITGKIINIIVVVNDEVEVGKAKEISDKVLEKLSDEEKKFYDVQIFVSKDNDDAKFPIVGYKHHNRDNTTWTKDR